MKITFLCLPLLVGGCLGPSVPSPGLDTWKMGDEPVEQVLLHVATIPAEDMYTVYGIAITSDASLAATTDGRGVVRVWNLTEAQFVNVYPGMDQVAAYAIAFSPDGSLLAIGRENGTIHIRSAIDGSLVHHFDGHAGSVRHLVFTPDGTSVLSASRDRLIEHRLGDPDAQNSLSVRGAYTAVAFCFGETTRILAAGMGYIDVLRWPCGEHIGRLAGAGRVSVAIDCRHEVQRAATADHAQHAFLTRAESGAIRFWSLEGKALLGAVRPGKLRETTPYEARSLQFICDDYLVAASHFDLRVIEFGGGTLQSVMEEGGYGLLAASPATGAIVRPGPRGDLTVWRVKLPVHEDDEND